ncbi:hypothetical protein RhiJN_09975 [Ceratobasidium sp. AG-Ba]|nr:hypothetical protein RhiJN_09975 [Ceratobasidium sp. AG-Ba]QRW10741.1 hypothetical protein RhiLY_09740 [Ceratobasidium sp. AG-Ba]
MAHVVDSRPRFNSYPTAINTQYAPAPKQYPSAYHYAAATPTTTPTKSHPGSSYPYRQANTSHSRLASAPVQQASSSSRAPPTRTASVPTARPSTSSAPVPVHRSTNPLPAAPEAFPHSRKSSMSRPSQSQSADPYRSAKRDDGYSSSRQQPESASARQARLLAEHEATLKRMEARQRKAEAQAWYEESQRLAAEAARKQQDEERRRAEEKARADENLRRAAQAKLDEEARRLNARKQERGRSQTHNPGAPSVDGGKWYHGIFGAKRDKSRDARGRKDDRGSDREQRGERERAKSEGRAREAKDARERIEKDRARNAASESAVASAWVTYEKTCSELMDAKPTKGKPLSSNLTFYDIPWPVIGNASSFHDLTTQNIAAFLLSPHHSQGKSRRARLRAAILIWHPDKFAQKVLPRVAESHRPAVVAAVNVVARIVTELISADGN